MHVQIYEHTIAILLTLALALARYVVITGINKNTGALYLLSTASRGNFLVLVSVLYSTLAINIWTSAHWKVKGEVKGNLHSKEQELILVRKQYTHYGFIKGPRPVYKSIVKQYNVY